MPRRGPGSKHGAQNARVRDVIGQIGQAVVAGANRFLPDITSKLAKTGKGVLEASEPMAVAGAKRLGTVARVARGPLPYIAGELAAPSKLNVGEDEFIRQRDIQYKQRQVSRLQDRRAARRRAMRGK